MRMNWKRTAAGLLAAQLAVAMTPGPEVQTKLAHFVSDQGDLVTVDPPDASRQPVFVALPLGPQTNRSVQQSEKSVPSGR